MSFIRPEAAAGLARWREALIGAALALAGLYWGLAGLGLVRWIGLAAALTGAALLWTGLQRARFGTGHGGLGLVEVDERQITYLSPVGGGAISLDALTRVSIVADRAGKAMWRFDTGGERLSVPAAAEGSATLFDALTALPGAQIETAIRALRSPPTAPVTIWRMHPRPVDTLVPIAHS